MREFAKSIELKEGEIAVIDDEQELDIDGGTFLEVLFRGLLAFRKDVKEAEDTLNDNPGSVVITGYEEK